MSDDLWRIMFGEYPPYGQRASDLVSSMQHAGGVQNEAEGQPRSELQWFDPYASEDSKPPSDGLLQLTGPHLPSSDSRLDPLPSLSGLGDSLQSFGLPSMPPTGVHQPPALLLPEPQPTGDYASYRDSSDPYLSDSSTPFSTASQSLSGSSPASLMPPTPGGLWLPVPGRRRSQSDPRPGGRDLPPPSQPANYEANYSEVIDPTLLLAGPYDRRGQSASEPSVPTLSNFLPAAPPAPAGRPRASTLDRSSHGTRPVHRGAPYSVPPSYGSASSSPFPSNRDGYEARTTLHPRSSHRTSPYPTPSSSSLVNRELAVSMHDMSLNTTAAGPSSSPGLSPSSSPVMQVMSIRAKVTSDAVRDAALKRRKSDAKASFACPLRECGMTFTRKTNFKGHMRSHRGEKPFICDFAGCGKGFARENDMKRHRKAHYRNGSA